MSFVFFVVVVVVVVAVAISWAAPVAYGGSQARGPIGPVATGLCHSHSNAEIQAASATYTTAHGNAGSLNPLSKGRDRTRNLMVPSQIR